jgi:hypothetical protein
LEGDAFATSFLTSSFVFFCSVGVGLFFGEGFGVTFGSTVFFGVGFTEGFGTGVGVTVRFGAGVATGVGTGVIVGNWMSLEVDGCGDDSSG